MPTIKFEVTNEGKIVAAYGGFSGDACLVAAEKLAAELKKLGVETDLKEFQRTTDNVREREVQRLG